MCQFNQGIATTFMYGLVFLQAGLKLLVALSPYALLAFVLKNNIPVRLAGVEYPIGYDCFPLQKFLIYARQD